LKRTSTSAFVYKIAVEQDQRRRGYGGVIMQTAERWSPTNGAATIGLHVFATITAPAACTSDSAT
jgi:GNAT superfamily N-acetyltransferase